MHSNHTWGRVCRIFSPRYILLVYRALRKICLIVFYIIFVQVISLSALLLADNRRLFSSRLCFVQKHIWPILLLYLYSGGRGILSKGVGGVDRGPGGRAEFPGYIPGSTSTAGAMLGHQQQQQQLAHYRHHGGLSSTNPSFIPSLDFTPLSKSTVASLPTRPRNRQSEQQQQQRLPLRSLSL